MTQPLWTAAEAGAATSAMVSGGGWAVSGVSIDTRTLSRGDLFVALRDQRDGHDFVDNAFAAGAAACLVERDMGRPGLVAPDVLAALTRLGEASRARCGGRMAAITGSVGKTSVKEMLARIFQAVGPAHWSEKSYNNHWGVPLTLARMPRVTERAIFEIGMSTPGEIAPRSRMVLPHVGIITKIAAAHVEGVGSIEAIAEEKSDIFTGLERNGVVVLPAEDRFFERLKANALARQPTARVMSFGRTHGDARVTGYHTDGSRSHIRFRIAGTDAETWLDAVGEHWSFNAVSAVLVASLMDVPVKTAADALAGYAPPAGRGVASGEFTRSGEPYTLVDDSYNANPESMRAALAAVAGRPGRKIIVLGEMLELGPDSAAMHAGLAEMVEAASPAVVILSGAGMKALAAELRRRGVCVEPQETAKADLALAALEPVITTGDLVLLKGSNASGLGRVGAALRQTSEAARSAQKAAGASNAV